MSAPGFRALRIEELRALIKMVPEHLRAGLWRWAGFGTRPGGFLQAVIRNDLCEAVNRADAASLQGLKPLALWLYNFAPGPSWGSREALDGWEQQHRELAAEGTLVLLHKARLRPDRDFEWLDYVKHFNTNFDGPLPDYVKAPPPWHREEAQASAHFDVDEEDGSVTARTWAK